MLTKVHYQDDQDALLEVCEGSLTTLIESGVKQASSCAFPPEVLNRYAPDDDHFLLHVVAMGDYETYGVNKNGDAFSKQANQTYHPTFVTHGHFYREHRNRDPKTQGIGFIKASAHNDEMNRVELLVWGDKKKAEEEYQMAKEGKQISVSMSCRIAHDRCSCCHKKAASRAEYCDHLKHHMNRYIPEFEKYAFAFNDHPTFFDISRVRNPADRIAHYLEFRFPGEKAATDNLVITGADWAEYEGISTPYPAVSGMKLQILQKLATEEAWWEHAIEDASPKSEFAKTARSSWVGDMDQSDLDAMRTMDMGTMFRKLASRRILLPFSTFAAYVKNASVDAIYEDPIFKQACGCLPGIFRMMMSGSGSSGMTDLCDAGTELQTSFYGGGRGDIVEKVMDKASERFSLDPDPLQRRTIHIILAKKASHKVEVPPVISPEAEGLALAYGHYKVSALTDMLSYTQLDEADYLNTVAQNKIYS